jgi:hypothetical protein
MEKGFETLFLTKNHQAGVRKGTGFFVTLSEALLPHTALALLL